MDVVVVETWDQSPPVSVDDDVGEWHIVDRTDSFDETVVDEDRTSSAFDCCIPDHHAHSAPRVRRIASPVDLRRSPKERWSAESTWECQEMSEGCDIWPVLSICRTTGGRIGGERME
jgi:hypothetical protein